MKKTNQLLVFVYTLVFVLTSQVGFAAPLANVDIFVDESSSCFSQSMDINEDPEDPLTTSNTLLKPSYTTSVSPRFLNLDPIQAAAHSEARAPPFV